MRIEQLIFITEIEKTGSIAITSERLHLSSQGISQAIKSLEEELGVMIFTRSRTGLQPTEIGYELISKAHEILSKIDEFREMTNFASEISGNLRIAAVSALSSRILPQTMAAFKNKYPKVNLKFKEVSAAYQIKKDILNNEADLGFVYMHSSNNESNQQFIKSHLIDSTLMICFHKNLELSKKQKLYGEDIVKYPIAGFGNNADTKEYYNLLSKYGEPNLLFQTESPETKRYFISQGWAIGIESELSLSYDPYLQRGDYIALPIYEFDSKVSYYSIRLKNQHLSIAAKEFLKELQVQVTNFKEKV
ncbi:LysR family transcriptional regulator [Gottfriedia acidiceleris]|uniref:LysR family transcriptional regulator n=1 Tax=Gottfriedia acidiceleris TaxID=371036 RepID=UPI003D1E290D